MIEGNTLEVSTCNEAITELADWIAHALKGEKTQLVRMVESFESRSIAADSLIGRYYDTMPQFKALCDKVADGSDMRRSMVREALRCLSDRFNQTKDAAATGRMVESSMRDLTASAA